MNKVLMKAVVDQAWFFSESGDDVVQQDAAVRQLEQLSSELKKLEPRDKSILVSFIDQLADEELRRGEPLKAKFLSELCENLGLSDP